MKSKCPSWLGFLLTVVLVPTGCSDTPEGAQALISLAPSSLTEAQVTLQQLDRLYETDPEAAREAVRKLRPKLDELNHLVARVEIAPEHFVEFYDPQAGGILIAERAPIENGRLLRDMDVAGHSAVELYRRLTGGATPPEALVQAEARRESAASSRTHDPTALEGFALEHVGPPGDDLPSVTQSWTGTDGQLWRDTVCFKSGDRSDCLPNRTGNGGTASNAKTSFAELAPYRGSVTMRRSYDNVLREVWPIFAGEHWWFFQSSATYAPCPSWQACGTREYYLRNHQWDVIDGEGDGYHFATAYRWNCSWIACDARP
ncbi:hypothetical protein [Myxococcus sp. Y35]|uniref:hypothetical protein n=1 Tax=Pseudomyxococcus flavus TaxID=3115648 RepID=UPI003CF0D887